jgi:SAM-dependent methyltransferase
MKDDLGNPASASAHSSGYFDGLFAASDDPWALRHRWYERRKRALTMEALPRERYGRAFEPGCANGELTALLALRCDTLLAADCSAAAVGLTTARVAGLGAVDVQQRTLPTEWPAGLFDLIVLSEMAYYLTPHDLGLVVQHAFAGLAPAGTLIACHWRPTFNEAPVSGDAVHAALAAGALAASATRLMRHEEQDFLLETWSDDPRSVAVRETR